MTDNVNKQRTSITIDPSLLARARKHCADVSSDSGRKVSFSELVSKALEAHIGPDLSTLTVSDSTEAE